MNELLVFTEHWITTTLNTLYHCAMSMRHGERMQWDDDD